MPITERSLDELKKIINVKDAELKYLILSCIEDSSGIIPELATILDTETLIKFLYLFGGTQVKVPTIEEFRESCNMIISYYLREVKKMSWEEITKIHPDVNPVSHSQKISSFKKKLSNINLDILKKIKDL